MNALLSEMFLSWFRSVFKLHLYDWWITAPNTHHSLFPICFFVCISSITWKSNSDCKSTTHQMTPPLPRIFCFKLKVAKWLQPKSYDPIQTLLSCCLVCKYKGQQNSGCLRLYCALNNCIPTKVASFKSIYIKWGTTYELPSSCFCRVFVQV